ncbi:MAG: hypothetical protein V3S82_09820, partial [Dehalococcoidia bacterium]
NENAAHLGDTNGSGQLKYAFGDEGRYLLVALKDDYRPGRTGIGIGDFPKALAIEAPKRAPAGEKVTLKVTQRNTHDPVKDAGVWALTGDAIEALKAEIARIKDEGGKPAVDLDWETFLNENAAHLGDTNGSGQLKYAFGDEGRYLLVAVKEGFRPGRTGIAIGDFPTAHATRGQVNAPAIRGLDRARFAIRTRNPVKDAGILDRASDAVRKHVVGLSAQSRGMSRGKSGGMSRGKSQSMSRGKSGSMFRGKSQSMFRGKSGGKSQGKSLGVSRDGGMRKWAPKFVEPMPFEVSAQ